MTLAKSSIDIARGYLDLVPDAPDRERLFGTIADEHERTVDAILAHRPGRRAARPPARRAALRSGCATRTSTR